MDFIDCITFATQRALDADLPPELLPLVITSQASLLSGRQAEHRGHSLWD